MPRYIKADKEYLEPFFYEHLTDNGMIAAQNAIDEVPTADVQEVKHGKWCKQGLVVDEYGDKHIGYICSVCKKFVPNKGNYCLECGAKMDLE